MHLKKAPLAEDIDIEELIGQTDQYTGADIAAVVRKAGRLALREDMEATEDLSKAFPCRLAGYWAVRHA